MTGIDIDALLTDISSESPCGRDISYDQAFIQLERFAQGTAGLQVGDHIQEGEAPDWRQVRRLSLELFEQSRDLRLTLYLILSSLCLYGIEGFCEGIALLHGLVTHHWEHIYPQLDPDDDNDPTERMNILGSLSPPNTVMSDQDSMQFRSRLLDAPLCTPEDSRLPRPTLRHILIASGEKPAPKEGGAQVPAMPLIDAAFEQTPVDDLQATDRALHDCLDHLNALDTFLINKVGTEAAPDFSGLERVLTQISSKISGHLERRGYGAEVSIIKQIQTKVGSILEKKRPNMKQMETANDNEQPAAGNNFQPALSGQITSKQEVLKALDMVVSYYEQNEPSSPVPLLIKRAKRLVGKSFVDIIRDLSPDAISQVNIVSGDQDDSGEE